MADPGINWADGVWAPGVWAPGVWAQAESPDLPPVLIGTIPTLSALTDSGTHDFNLSAYFTGATSYAISPAVETGWSFDTGTGVLTIDTDVEDVFGPYTVTATNANGDTDSNAFLVRVSTFLAAGFMGGTAVSDMGIMGTIYLGTSAVPAGAFIVNGFAHSSDGMRYVCDMPARPFFEGGVAKRDDGAMVITTSGGIAGYGHGFALTDDGSVLVVVDTPDLVRSGFGFLQSGELCVSEAA